VWPAGHREGVPAHVRAGAGTTLPGDPPHGEGDEAWLAWEFEFHFRGWKEAELQCIRGATHLRFAADGRVIAHRDYWDSGEELFSRLPLVGTLVNWLRRRMSAA
jgi:hypothetical protein